MEKGGRIRYIRETVLRMSQGEFSAVLDISQMSLSHWEAGTRNPKGQQIDKIIAFCNSKGIDVSKEWIESGKGKMLTKDMAFVKYDNKIEHVANTKDSSSPTTGYKFEKPDEEKKSKDADYWKDKYIDLLEKFNGLK